MQHHNAIIMRFWQHFDLTLPHVNKQYFNQTNAIKIIIGVTIFALNYANCNRNKQHVNTLIALLLL